MEKAKNTRECFLIAVISEMEQEQPMYLLHDICAEVGEYITIREVETGKLVPFKVREELERRYKALMSVETEIIEQSIETSKELIPFAAKCMMGCLIVMGLLSVIV